MNKNIERFWESGNGRQLTKWSGAQIGRGGLEGMTILRGQFDILGDKAVREVFDNRDLKEAFAYINSLSGRPVCETEDLPQGVKMLFLEMQRMPDWLDDSLIEAGCSLCMRSGNNALVSLRDYSLMSGYDYAYLNKALLFTGALKKGPAKRITDTLDFWIHVTRGKTLPIHGIGYQYVARTRMIHSYSRMMIKKKFTNWETATWGEPINLADMIATNLAFSLIFLHGLHKLGLRISEKEELGLFHLWKYIGFLLGIPVEHLPDNKKQATEIFYVWTCGQISADEGSILLATALENEAVVSDIFKKNYQKRFVRYLHICYVRYLIDKETCKRLKVSKVPVYYLFPRFRKLRNLMKECIVWLSAENYQSAVRLGDIIQVKICEQYLLRDSHKTP